MQIQIDESRIDEVGTGWIYESPKTGIRVECRTLDEAIREHVKQSPELMTGRD